jgi:hypothetical protein
MRSRAHGWTFDAPFQLGLPIGDGVPADVVIHIEEDAQAEPVDELTGVRLASLATDRPWYELVETGRRRFTLRFHGLADVIIDADSFPLSVSCRWHPGADRERLRVLLAGTTVSALLLLNGHAVLHASAVRRDGRTIALVGHSGAGKSTLSAVACASGALLLADDVLRVETDADGPWCYRGSLSLRLRPTSKALAIGGNTSMEVSADGRHLWSPSSVEDERCRLDGIVLPRLRGDDHPLIATRLDPRDAVFALLGTPRISDWSHAASNMHQFETIAAVVGQVPVVRLDIPWGMHLDPASASRISDAIFALCLGT